MRQKRAKTYRKLMSLYSLTFGFRQPYQILVDSEFCKDLRNLNVDVNKQLSTVLQGTVKPMITQCCIHELYLQGREQQAAVDIAKTFERRKCNHREAIPGDECLSSVVGDTNKHRYVIATQSQPLRAKLRTIPAVPIVHINRSVMILEPPSDATLAAKTSAEDKTQRPTTTEVTKLGQQAALHAPDEPPRKKRKGPKAPNPLSAMKKKVQVDPRQGGRAQNKRAADSDQESDVELTQDAPALSDPAATEAPRGHKRKRRRKTASTRPTEVAEENGSGSE